MADFQKAFDALMKFEDADLSGKVVEDMGSVSKYGIRQANHPDIDVTTLTLEEAEALFRDEYFTPMHLQDIENQLVADKLLNMSANMGVTQAAHLAQEAARAAGARIEQDNVCGPKTVEAINIIDAPAFLKLLRSFSLTFYHHVALHKGGVSDDVWASWVRRANA